MVQLTRQTSLQSLCHPALKSVQTIYIVLNEISLDILMHELYS